MPIVNLGAQRNRSRVVADVEKVDSVAIGDSNAAESLTVAKAGVGGNAHWKNTATGVTLTDSSATDTTATTNPFWQLEATYSTSEFNGNTVFEICTGAGALNGVNPAADNGTRLYSRKRVGGATGLGKTADYSLVVRVKMTYPST
jgi:hypothetical protein